MSDYIVDIKNIEEYNTHQSDINPKKAALLIIEMQEIFRSDLNIISSWQIDNIRKLIEFAEDNGTKIIYIRHHDDEVKSKNMISWWGGDKVEKDSPGWQIMKEFDTNGKTIVDKYQYSAFFETNLDNILRTNNIEEVIITGVMTNCCCETATRDAFMRGYKVFFVNDATSTINEELHLAALKNLAFGFACIKNTDHILSKN